NQQKIVWPRNLVVAKAYIDQLERSKAVPAEQIASMRQAIEKGDKGKYKGFASSLETSAGQTKNVADSSRMLALAEILKKPAA
ncbi:MAG TPA: hypothetical protein VHL50_11610, partial [Pyrinomonadaceae bacterium]|nr:hypothetical protein [Pyrinomonadaceae bacterium]